MKLSKYRKIRNFKRTPEPEGKIKKSKDLTFVIQRHHATRLHFDFRLELNGVLKSWAVPKGMPLTSNDKRIGIQTEDHPLEYGKFKGTIPEGNYGAGTVSIWDKGKYSNQTTKYKTLEEGIKKGHFVIELKGKYVYGLYGFTKMNKDWIIVKKKTYESKEYPDSLSIKYGKNQVEFTNLNKLIFKNLSKGDYIEYYAKVSNHILKQISNRPISMYRFPNGTLNPGFFQKNISEYFPKWLKKISIKHKTGTTQYLICNDKASLMYLVNQVAVPHIYTSNIKKLNYPDKMIFDLDPSSENLSELRKIILELKKFLQKLGFKPYIMTTGGKGFHISVPIKQYSTNDEVREFTGKITQVFSSYYPEVTTEFTKKKRDNKILIDVNRNSPHQTAVAPYSVRATEKATIAMPIYWNELEVVHPQTFTIDTAQDRLKKSDPWEDFFKNPKSIKAIKKKLANH